MSHFTTLPSSNVEVGTWPGFASCGRDKRTGGLWPWMDSQYHCGYISHGHLRFSDVSSTWYFPILTTTTSQSRFNAPVPWTHIPLRQQRPLLFNPRTVPWSHFVATRSHWYPYIPSTDSLHSTRTFLYFFISTTLRMCYLYLILLSTSILDVVSRCLNTPTIRLRVVQITAGPKLSHVSIYGNFLLIRFFLDTASI